METLLLQLLQDYWYEAVMTILGLGFLAKFVALKSAITEFMDYVKQLIISKADGKISEAEYADIGRKAVKFSYTLAGIAKGLFPNRSKT